MTQIQCFFEDAGSPSRIATMAVFCGFGDGKPYPLTCGIPPSPEPVGKPFHPTGTAERGGRAHG